MTFDFLIATVLTILGFIATLIGSYYARHSYLLTLKNYEKDKSDPKKRNIIMKHTSIYHQAKKSQHS